MKTPNSKSTDPANNSDKSKLRPRSGVRAGGLTANHGLRVRSKVRAGGLSYNHGLRVRAA